MTDRPTCFCPMRDGAHEAACGRVGEYESVHCLDCDRPTWMCAVSLSRCRPCRETYEASPAYKALMAESQREFLRQWREQQKPEPPIGVVGDIQPDGSAEVILTDEGRRLYGEHFRLIITNAGEPAADTPTVVEGP